MASLQGKDHRRAAAAGSPGQGFLRRAAGQQPHQARVHRRGHARRLSVRAVTDTLRPRPAARAGDTGGRGRGAGTARGEVLHRADRHRGAAAAPRDARPERPHRPGRDRLPDRSADRAVRRHRVPARAGDRALLQHQHRHAHDTGVAGTARSDPRQGAGTQRRSRPGGREAGPRSGDGSRRTSPGGGTGRSRSAVRLPRRPDPPVHPRAGRGAATLPRRLEGGRGEEGGGPPGSIWTRRGPGCPRHAALPAGGPVRGADDRRGPATWCGERTGARPPGRDHDGGRVGTAAPVGHA